MEHLVIYRVNPGTEIMEYWCTEEEKRRKTYGRGIESERSVTHDRPYIGLSAWMRFCTDNRPLGACPHCNDALAQGLIARRQLSVNYYRHVR